MYISSGFYCRKHSLNRQVLSTTTLKMHAAVVKIMAVVVVAIMISNFFYCVDATYRKPPFNGSIFGKRGTAIEYDSASKALSSMCEIASEACQAWFPAQEK